MWVEEPNPLKQGLKLIYAILVRKDISVEEPNPLKQGLKPPSVVPATAWLLG